MWYMQNLNVQYFGVAMLHRQMVSEILSSCLLYIFLILVVNIKLRGGSLAEYVSDFISVLLVCVLSFPCINNIFVYYWAITYYGSTDRCAARQSSVRFNERRSQDHVVFRGAEL